MGKLQNKKIANYKSQNYAEIKKQHAELGTLFIDSTFPAIDAVIGPSEVPANLTWKRPKDITENPRLFVDDENSRVVKPGQLSCNWMVSACAILAGVNEIRNRVVPDYWDQEWSDKTYCGLFHFKFWRFGQWVDVVVDDLLPTVDNTLLTTQSGVENEFWPALVEKAYAKLHGSYEALREGELSDALVDFTGGVSETIDLTAGRFNEIEDKRSQLFDTLHKEMGDHSVVCFTVGVPSTGKIGDRSDLGLIKGHTYHLTDIKKVHLGETTLRTLFNGREKVSVIRVRDAREEEKKPPGSPDSALSGEGNPFAYSTDVLARLRSKNSEWQQIKESERQRLGLVFRDPSEFWMPLEDAVSEFNDVTICRLVNENFFVAPGKKWKGSGCRGEWEDGPKDTKLDRAGGGDPSLESFLRNPQFIVDIKSEIEIMVQLLQYQDDETKSPNRINLLLGLHMIKVENNRTTRLHKLWPYNPIVVEEDHKRKRELVYRGQLSSGRYLILPTLYKAGDTALFLLRVFSKDDQLNLKELKEDVPKSLNPCSCIMPDYQWVTVIVVESAQLEIKSSSWMSARISPMCSISCEGKTVKTHVAKDDVKPEWHSAFVFYRKKPDKPIVLKIFNKNTIMPNELIGECELPAAVTHSPTTLDATLKRKSRNSDENSSVINAGTVQLLILTEDSLNAV